ncbi:MAG TPA: sulfotransferase family 2 domain-containing protein [Xanthobacteraceae bacterium]|nr:sulfotransferase family 2 domain-containing protein [Xanthobacteraceae bacterium]
MRKRELHSSGIPGLEPPEVLIFFHIPKTGGSTMGGVFEHLFPNQYFHAHVGPTDSALLVRDTKRIGELFRQMPVEKRQLVRCLIGIHVAMDVDTIFDRPSKFFTIVRDPIDRAISNFFDNRNQPHLVSYPFIKDLTLEQYLDSGIGLDAHNHQVRMLSGCAELDAPWDPEGRPISTPPVERRHLEMAKKNIEDRFIVAAPLEQFSALVWFFKRLYGVPMHRMFYQVRNETPGRQKAESVSEATRKRLRAWNSYDLELYEWVRQRFSAQIAPLEPQFSREVARFNAMNRLVQRLGRLSPQLVRKRVRSLLFKPAALSQAGQPTSAPF